MANDLKEKEYNPTQDDYEERFGFESRSNTDTPTSNEVDHDESANYNRDEEETDLREREEAPDNDDAELDSSSNESFPEEDQNSDSDFYTPDGKQRRTASRFNLKQHWKKYALGVVLTGALGGTGVFLFIFLPSLKVPNFINNLEQRFMGVATNAVEARAEHLLSRYMRNYVFPSVKKCSTVISINCNHDYDSSRGIVSNLYNNWHNARIEQKLFVNHGIQIEYRQGTPDGYTIITRGGNRVDVVGSSFELSDLSRQDNLSAGDVRKELKRILENETRWNRLLYRRSVRKLARAKWNIRWCLIACDTRDSARETRLSALHRLKTGMIERTVSPFSDRLGLYLNCAVTDCSSEKFLNDRSQMLNNAIEELGEDEVRRIIDEFDGGNRRLSQVVVDKILSKVFGTTAGRVGASAVPLVGWLYAVDAVDQIDRKLYEGVISEYLADSNASQYAEFYLTFRAHYDEGVSGRLTLDEIGAQSQLFDGVEGSQVYQQEFGARDNPIAKLFGSPVYAQEEYVCGDGEPIPLGNMVCEERKVGRQSGYDSWRKTDTANFIINNLLGSYRCGPLGIANLADPDFCTPGSLADRWPVDTILHGIFGVFNSVLDAVAGAIISAAEVIPGASQVFGLFMEQVGKLVQLLIEMVFPYLNLGNGPGRQVFDDLYAGVDVVGNDFAKGMVDPATGEQLGIGGALLTDQEVEDNIAVLENKQREDFKSKGLLARLFSPNLEKSALTQLAMSVPRVNNFNEGARNLLALINPFNTMPALASGIANTAYAQETRHYLGDPFGIDQYGYAIDDENLYVDPEELTEESCNPGGEYFERWKDGIIGDDNGEVTESGQVQYTVSNPCLLEWTTTNILGCWFTDDDDCGVGQATSTSGPGIGQVIVGDTSNLPCEAGADAGVGDGYARGELYKIRLCNVQGIIVNSQISGELNALLNSAAAGGIDFGGGGFRTMESQISLRRSHCGTSNYDIYHKPSSQCSPPTARPGYSNHQMGLAIDFTCNGLGIINKSSRPGTTICFNWLSANAASYGLYNLPSENWHWSVDGR